MGFHEAARLLAGVARLKRVEPRPEFGSQIGVQRERVVPRAPRRLRVVRIHPQIPQKIMY